MIDEYYKKNFNLLVNKLISKNINQEDAEDIVQSAFLRAIKAQDRIRNIGAWIRLAINSEANNFFAHNRMKNKIIFALGENEEGTNPFSAEHVAICQEELSIMKEKIAKVENDDHRCILEGVLICGVEYDEMSALTTYPEATIRTIVCRWREENCN